MGAEVSEEKEKGYEDIENFFKNYPGELQELKEKFEKVFRKLSAKESYELDVINETTEKKLVLILPPEQVGEIAKKTMSVLTSDVKKP